MKIRDLAERFVWTVIAAALSNLVGVGLLDLSAWQAAALAGLNGGATFVLVVARWRLSVLPDPGAGLPGLPVDDTVNVAERLGLPYDSEPSTYDSGAVDLATINTICLLIIAAVAVAFAFGEVPF